MRGINEECGVFGIFNHPDASQLTYFGLHHLQHRGQEGAGIVTFDGEDVNSHKGLGLLSEVFKDKTKLTDLKGDKAVGHVRYCTFGNNSYKNVQPFRFDFHDLNIALAHNGNLINAKSLRLELEKQGSVFFSTSDSEILIHLIRRSQKETLKEKIKESLNIVKGSFSYVLLTKDTLYAAVDPNAFRPLAVGKTKSNAYVVASETCALDAIGAEYICDIEAGQIAEINAEGMFIEQYTNETRTAITAMEYIYFARPDSDIAGVNVHSARKNTGKRLAQECPADADIVIGVPNSSLSAASGFAEEAGLPYEMGLIKNQYSQRTFIEPTQELREQGVRMKLIPVKGVVSGKRVVMVDDSIVRGTTSLRIVNLLKEAGALEVHVRVASPPLLFPSFYGIDLSTTSELIAANKTLEEIREYIGADSLGFLSEEGLIDSIGVKKDAPYGGLCMDSFNGDYAAGLYDYEEQFNKSLTKIQKEFLKNKGK